MGAKPQLIQIGLATPRTSLPRFVPRSFALSSAIQGDGNPRAPRGALPRKNVIGQLPSRAWGGAAESVRWRLRQGRSACAKSARSHQPWPCVIGRAVGVRRDDSWTSFAPSRDDIVSTRSAHCQWTGHRDPPCRGARAGPMGFPFALH